MVAGKWRCSFFVPSRNLNFSINLSYIQKSNNFLDDYLKNECQNGKRMGEDKDIGDLSLLRKKENTLKIHRI